MALPSLDTSIFARQTYDGATVAQTFLQSYREAQKIAMDKEQMARENALTDEKTQWLREDRQRKKEVLDPIEEERAKLSVMQDKLQNERLRWQLKSQRRDAEAELSAFGAMETNDGLGDELIGKLASLSQSAPGDPANDDEVTSTFDQLKALTESGAFTPAMEARAKATIGQAQFSPRLKAAKDSQFIRNGIIGIRDTLASLPTDQQLTALKAIGLPVKDFSAKDGESFMTLSQDVTSAQVSAAIDRLGGYVEAQAKAQAKTSPVESTSVFTLKEMISDVKLPEATRKQAQALLDMKLSAESGLPMGAGATKDNPILPSVKEMSTEALKRLTGK